MSTPMNVLAPVPALRPMADAPVVVGFVAIKQTPRLLVSLGSKIPRDIVPMPVDRLSTLCQRQRTAPVALHGLVVCVPQSRLPPEDRALIDDLATLIPVLRVGEDGREAGLTFFDRCRQATPKVPRSVTRLVYRQPVIVHRIGRAEEPRLLLSENVSPGGVFVHDPHLSCNSGDRLSLRFPGLRKVPELAGEIRWVQPDGTVGQLRGYGCAFDTALDLAVRRLLDEAQTPGEQASEEPPVLRKLRLGRGYRR